MAKESDSTRYPDIVQENGASDAGLELMSKPRLRAAGPYSTYAACYGTVGSVERNCLLDAILIRYDSSFDHQLILRCLASTTNFPVREVLMFPQGVHHCSQTNAQYAAEPVPYKTQ